MFLQPLHLPSSCLGRPLPVLPPGRDGVDQVFSPRRPVPSVFKQVVGETRTLSWHVGSCSQRTSTSRVHFWSLGSGTPLQSEGTLRRTPSSRDCPQSEGWEQRLTSNQQAGSEPLTSVCKDDVHARLPVCRNQQKWQGAKSEEGDKSDSRRLWKANGAVGTPVRHRGTCDHSEGGQPRSPTDGGAFHPELERGAAWAFDELRLCSLRHLRLNFQRGASGLGTRFLF